MSYNNQNLFQDTVVFGNFINCDDIKTGGNQAFAKFKRDVLVGGDLQLGREISTTIDGVTTYENTGGNFIVKINGITYTITPQILSYLSTLTNDIPTTISNYSGDLSISNLTTSGNISQNVRGKTCNLKTTTINGTITQTYTQADVIAGASSYTTTLLDTTVKTLSSKSDVTLFTTGSGNLYFYNGATKLTLTPTILSYLTNITEDIQSQISNMSSSLPDLSLYAPKASPTFTGTPLAPTPSTADNSTQIATTAFVKAQGYLTSVTPPDLSSYAPLVSPSFSGKVCINSNTYCSF